AFPGAAGTGRCRLFLARSPPGTRAMEFDSFGYLSGRRPGNDFYRQRAPGGHSFRPESGGRALGIPYLFGGANLQVKQTFRLYREPGLFLAVARISSGAIPLPPGLTAETGRPTRYRSQA